MTLLKIDFIAIAAMTIFAIFTIAILVTPSVLTFLLFKSLKKKGKIFKVIGLTLFIFVTIYMLFATYKLLTEESGFETKYENVEIKQKIGGTLLCSSTYDADQHSWDYDIQYKFKDVNDSIYDIGNGTYHGEEWKKNEQLIKYDNWRILKTSFSRDADKLYIGDIKSKLWKEFIISPENIEKFKLWKDQKINSETDNWDSVSKIEKINDNGIFTVIYQYRKSDSSLFSRNGKRRIYFRIDRVTGIPEIIKVSKI